MIRRVARLRRGLLYAHAAGFAAAIAPLAERTGAANPFDGVSVAFISAPSFADLDGDGDLDALVGESDRHAAYFQNTGARPARPSPSRPAPPTPSAASTSASTDAGLPTWTATATSTPSWGIRTATCTTSRTRGRPAPAYAAQHRRRQPLLRHRCRLPIGTPASGTWTATATSTPSSGKASARCSTSRTRGRPPPRLRRADRRRQPLRRHRRRASAVACGPGRRRRPRRPRGGSDGTLRYYQNTGTATAPAYAAADRRRQPLRRHRRRRLCNAPAWGRGRRRRPRRPRGGMRRHAAVLPEHGDGDQPGLRRADRRRQPLQRHRRRRSTAAPSFGDLDGDGDLDALVGEFDGTLRVLQEHGDGDQPGLHPADRRRQPLQRHRRRRLRAPSFGDVDGDGDLDALVGESDGTLRYFKNTGTATARSSPQQTGAANPFGGIAVGGSQHAGFGDVDGDGDLDALVGDCAAPCAISRTRGRRPPGLRRAAPAPPTPSAARRRGPEARPLWGRRRRRRPRRPRSGNKTAT